MTVGLDVPGAAAERPAASSVRARSSLQRWLAPPPPGPTRGRGAAVLQSALLGASSGLRSQLGLAALVWAHDPDRLPALERHRTVRRAVLVTAVGELVADKLPKVPSRLAAGPLAARVVLGGLAAGESARIRRRPVVPAVLVAGVAALVAARVGHAVRAALAERMSDRVGAVAEDAVAIGLAAVAVRTG